ncbi:MAG: RNA polymerase sigma-54 factor, partial [Alphaproteobacteria bacterium]|nr:RNA polymerase sigma-54 factor [Alphaproteobacteria bacterium]
MALSQQLSLSQSQQLVMTPQLQQAIKLLQMSSQELAAFVATEMETNPLLEKADDDRTTSDTTAEAAPEGLNGDVSFEGTENFGDDSPWDSPWSDDSAHLSKSSAAPFDDDCEGLSHISERPSLRDHLHQQMEIDVADAAEKMVVAALIELLDDAGYLPPDLHVARAQLGADEQTFIRAIEKIQAMDPCGIGARNLAECLTLQLKEQNRFDPAIEIFLQHLDLVARRDMAALSRLCGVDTADVADMLADIRRLNPKPAAAFTHDVAATLIPDVLLRPIPGGSWHVELNSAALPRVLANEKYYVHMTKGNITKQDKGYLSERWQQANWLVKSLAQRAETILKVSIEIVARQDAFFVNIAGPFLLYLFEEVLVDFKNNLQVPGKNLTEK